MKTGLCFPFPGFLIFSKKFILMVQCPTQPFWLNLFLWNIYPTTFNPTETLNHYGKYPIKSLKQLALFFRQIKEWLVPFKYFKVVKFELWGLGLKFKPKKLLYIKTFLKRESTHIFHGIKPKPIKLMYRYWRFKIGLSHALCLFELPGFRFIYQKKSSDFRRRIFFAICNEIKPLIMYSMLLRNAKGINVYKYRGIKYSSETVKMKIGKAVRLG